MANLGILNNNAGNLKDPTTGTFHKFNSPEEGRQALMDDLEVKKSGKSAHIKPGGTIKDLAMVWAPSSDNNNPNDWANNVAKTVGVNSDASWADIPTDKLADGIQVAEGTSTPSKASTPSSHHLSHEQLTANINAMEQQGAKPEEVQSYLDSLKGGDTQASPKRKTFTEDIGDTNTPEQSQHSGILGTSSGDSTTGKVLDNSLTRGLVNLVPGAKTLGDSIGTLGGLGYEKLKGLFGGKDNSAEYDTSAPSVGKTALAGAEFASNALIPKGLSALGSALAKTAPLAEPEIAEILKGALGKGETISNLSRQDAINTLGNYLKEMPVTESGGQTEQKILKALKSLNPTLVEKQNLLSTLVKKGYNLASHTALASLLGNTVGGLIHQGISK